MLGNAFEWYGYAIYMYLTVTLGNVFFPGDNQFAQQLQVFGVFAIGFAVRPLGAIIFGHIGDKYGRKLALILSILLMSVPTFCIGILPTYEKIGIMAPILLVVLRILQGVSVGGNFGGAITFLTEYATDRTRGLFGSWSVFSCIGGILIGNSVVSMISITYGADALQEWAWRIPFASGLLVGGVAWIMQYFIDESPVFEEAHKDDTPTALKESPTIKFIRENPRMVLMGVLVVMLNDVGFYTMYNFFPNHIQVKYNLCRDVVDDINVQSLAVMALSIPIFGHLSDIFGRKKILATSAILFMVCSIPLFLILENLPNTVSQDDLIMTLRFMQLFFAITLGAYFGPLAATIVEMFRTKERYSAVSIALNFSAAIFGGTAPLLASYFTNLDFFYLGDGVYLTSYFPAIYLTFAGFVSLLTVLKLRETARAPLN